MSLFAELKRRNVFRVAIAYVIVGWLVMQIGEVMSPALRLPEWSNSFLAWLLILGFPVAMLFAWVYELTPEGIRRERDVRREASITPRTGQKLNIAIIVLLALALAYFVWESRLSGRPSPEKEAAAMPAKPKAVEASEPATGNRRSIAVLPFANRSQREEDLFFTDGIHDDLLTQLARIDDLKVISRTSVMGYRDTDKNLRQIGEELGVATVLEGGVQRAGEQVRINVQLIDAGSDEHLWAQTYDRELTAQNVFAIQSEIAAAIADALQAALSPEEKAKLASTPTDNLAAYDHYLVARQLGDRGNWDSLEQALKELEAAVQLDPNFAQAWALKGNTYLQLVDTGARSRQSVESSWKAAVDRALELAPDSAAAQVAMGNLLQEDEPDRARKAFETALDLEPGNSEVLLANAFNMIYREDYPAALRLLLEARELDPLSTRVLFVLSRVYLVLGQVDEASDMLARIRSIDPSSSSGKGPASGPYMMRGEMAQSLYWLFEGWKADRGDLDLLGWVVREYVDIGDETAAREWLRYLVSLDPDYTLTLAVRAMMATLDGQLDEAVSLARRYFEKGMDNRWGSRPIMTRVLLLDAMANGDPDLALDLMRDQVPEFFGEQPEIASNNAADAVDVSHLLKLADREEESIRLLEAVMTYVSQPYALGGDIGEWKRTVPAQALCLLGQGDEALAELKTRVEAGWRLQWRWETELNPHFDAIRERPEFQALVASIKASMDRERAKVDGMLATGEIPAPPEAGS